MKTLFVIILILALTSCKENSCDEESEGYWTGNFITQKLHETKIEGENVTIRNAFKEIIESEKNIEPDEGFITLRLHLDKNGFFCEQDVFEIDTDYMLISFNKGILAKKLSNISSSLSGWTNQTNTKTYYLIRLKIKHGEIVEIF